jgi:hypothetical protein
MKRSLFTHIMIFFLGVVAGIAIINWFVASLYTPSPVHVPVERPAITKARITAAEQHFRGKIDPLCFANGQLQDKMDSTKSALKQAKRKNRQLEKQVQQMIWLNDSVTDTTMLLDNCDSLSVIVQDLLLLNIAKDSLYDSMTTGLEQQIAGKDSVIVLQGQQYDTLKLSFDKTLLQQQELIISNQQLDPQFRKQKKQKRLLSAVLVLLGGLAAYSTLK